MKIKKGRLWNEGEGEGIKITATRRKILLWECNGYTRISYRPTEDALFGFRVSYLGIVCASVYLQLKLNGTSQ
jgi:hypothetical protein